jgi:hypothetical protein
LYYVLLLQQPDWLLEVDGAGDRNRDRLEMSAGLEWEEQMGQRGRLIVWQPGWRVKVDGAEDRDRLGVAVSLG